MNRVALVTLGCALLAGTSLAAAPARAEEAPPPAPVKKLSLADCLAHLDARHPLLAAAQSDVDAAAARRNAMSGKGLPTINALGLVGPTPAAHGDAEGTSTPTNDYWGMLESLGPFFRAELSITQPLWTFGKLDAATRATDEAVKMQRSRADAVRWELVTQVKSLYYGWLLLRHLDGLLDDVQGKVRQARTYLDEQLAAGTGDVSDLDRLRIDSYAREVDLQRLEVGKRLTTLRDGLTRLLQLDPSQPWEPADERLEPLPAPTLALDALYAIAESHQPDLQAGQHGVRALEAKAAAMRARYYPDVFLAGQMRYGVAPGRDRQTNPYLVENFNFFDFGAAVGLRWSWDTGVVGPEADAAHAELMAARERVRALGEKVRHDVFAARTELEASRQQVEVATDAYRTGRSWVAMAYERFELGTASAKDLVDGLAGFVKARYTYLQAAFDYNLTVARLSSVVGEELQTDLVHPAP